MHWAWCLLPANSRVAAGGRCRPVCGRLCCTTHSYSCCERYMLVWCLRVPARISQQPPADRGGCFPSSAAAGAGCVDDRVIFPLSCSLTGGNFDAAAASTSRYLPVESAMPGTTLGIIPLQAFETGGTLYGRGGWSAGAAGSALWAGCVWSLCIVWLWVRQQAGSNWLSSLQASSSHCMWLFVCWSADSCPCLPAPAPSCCSCRHPRCAPAPPCAPHAGT